jgi:PKD repeat protein
MRMLEYIMEKKMRFVLLFLGIGFLVLSGCLHLGENLPPLACFSHLPSEGYPPLLVQFDACGSYDPDGRIVSYAWEFGDGETATGKSVAHTYEGSGTYPVTLCVRDHRDAEGLATATVVVREIPEGYLLRRYEWEWQEDQYWDMFIPESLYQMYHERVRQPFVNNYSYDEYVLDPLDDPTLGDLAQALLNRVGGVEEAFLECALAFVQGAIKYVLDPAAFEYPLYPLETLVDGRGDCEDTTILYVSLLRGLGHPVSMAFVDTDDDDIPDHVTALVPVPPSYASSLTCSLGMNKGVWEIEDQSYVLAETAVNPETSGYLSLGCDPWGLSEDDFKEIWDF